MAVIITPVRQEYFYHELESRVSVFSHVKENFKVKCGDVQSQHCLGKGLNSLLLPVGCEAATSELRIMAPSVGAGDTTLKPLIHELDLVDEIGELGKDLVALHGINVSMLSGESWLLTLSFFLLYYSIEVSLSHFSISLFFLTVVDF